MKKIELSILAMMLPKCEKLMAKDFAPVLSWENDCMLAEVVSKVL